MSELLELLKWQSIALPDIQRLLNLGWIIGFLFGFYLAKFLYSVNGG